MGQINLKTVFIYVKKGLFFYLFLASFILFAQNSKKIDSLSGLLHNGTFSSAEYSKILTDIAFFHPKVDTALILAKQSLDIAIRINNPILKAKAWEVISDKERILGNNQKSYQATFNALQVYESFKMIEEQAASYAQLANNYMIDKEYIESIKYLEKAISIYEVSDEYGNKIFAILNLGEMHRLAGNLETAKVSFKKVLNINIKIKSEAAKSYSLGNLGMVYSSQDSLQLAKENLQEAIAILTQLDDIYATSVFLAELGDVFQKERNPKAAEEKLLEALTMAQESGLKEQIRDFSDKLTRFYEGQGEYSKALQYQKLFQVYQDSLVNKTNIQEIERLKAGYEIDQRESQIGLLNTLNTKQKYLLWTLGSGAFATLVFLYLIFKVNKRVKKANIRLTEQKVVIAQREQEKTLLLRELNHRIKNNLQLISSLLNLQSNELSGHPAKDALVTGQYRVEALSLVYRKLYQEGAESKVELKDYIEELVLGLFHSYDISFTPEINVVPITIGIDTAVPIALIINELVTNAIKYAYKNNNKPTLKICVKNRNNEVTIDILDNGEGFTKKEQYKSNSLGIKLVTSLAIQLGGELKLMQNTGTHWKLTLNNFEL
ncbi:MAG: histidine kinase [Flavobacteriaceae bacterium]|nr:MAG: histidine kinase [Flavobacteriaceae bacterium]